MAGRLQRKTSAPKLTQEDYANLIASEYRKPERTAGWFTATEMEHLIGVTNFRRWVATNAPNDFEVSKMRVGGAVKIVYKRKAQS